MQQKLLCVEYLTGNVEKREFTPKTLHNVDESLENFDVLHIFTGSNIFCVPGRNKIIRLLSCHKFIQSLLGVLQVNVLKKIAI